MSARPWTSVALIVFVLGLGVYLGTLPVAAFAPQFGGSQRYVATTGSDTGNCTNTSGNPVCRTIGYAIAQSVAGSASISDTINIASGTYAENLVISKYIILQGSSSDGTQVVIDGGSLDSVIHANSPRLTINNLTLQNGNAAAGLVGGGINVGSTSQVTLRNSFVRHNTAAGGGGIYVPNGGALSIVRSSIESNSATGGNGGGVLGDPGSSVSVYSAAIISNTASSNGGGVYSSGATTLTDSTISGNTANPGGGGVAANSGVISLSFVTVANNTSTSNGGGVYAAGGTITAQNTIVAANNGPAGSPNCSGTLNSGDYNLIGSTTGCVFAAAAHDQIASITLGALGFNGGYTLNQALTVGSPAVDKANPACTDAAGNPVTADQRGASRPQGAACDIGAFELGNAPVLTNISPDLASVGSGGFVMTLTGQGFGVNARVLWVPTGSVTVTLIPSTTTGTQITTWISSTLISGAGVDNVAVQNYGQAAPNISNPLPFTINGQNQTITFPPIANHTSVDPSFTISASASSGLGVTFSAAGQCQVGATTNTAQVSILGIGTCTITANQGGNSVYNAAPPVAQSFAINIGIGHYFLPNIEK